MSTFSLMPWLLRLFWLQFGIAMSSNDNLTREMWPANELPLVTAIMPTHFDREMFFSSALRQAHEQTYPNLQLVIIDDSPGSKKLFSSLGYVNIPSWIRYMHVLPATVGSKRNMGVTNAQGSVIIHWDDDDSYEKTRIARLVTPIIENRADLVIPRSGLWYIAQEDRFADGRSMGFLMGHMAYHKKNVIRDFSCNYPDSSIDEDMFLVTCIAYAGGRISTSAPYATLLRHKNTWKVSASHLPTVTNIASFLAKGIRDSNIPDTANSIDIRHQARALGEIGRRAAAKSFLQDAHHFSRRLYYYDMSRDGLAINFISYIAMPRMPNFANPTFHNGLLVAKEQLKDHKLFCACPIEVDLPCPCSKTRWKRQQRRLAVSGDNATSANYKNRSDNANVTAIFLNNTNITAISLNITNATEETVEELETVADIEDPWYLKYMTWYYLVAAGSSMLLLLLIFFRCLWKLCHPKNNAKKDGDLTPRFDDELKYDIVPDVLKEFNWNPPSPRTCPTCKNSITIFNSNGNRCTSCALENEQQKLLTGNGATPAPFEVPFATEQDRAHNIIASASKYRLHADGLELLRRKYVKKRFRNHVLDSAFANLHTPPPPALCKAKEKEEG